MSSKIAFERNELLGFEFEIEFLEVTSKKGKQKKEKHTQNKFARLHEKMRAGLHTITEHTLGRFRHLKIRFRPKS